MSLEGSFPNGEDRLAGRLNRIYTRATLGYLFVVVVLWALGFEAIYGSPTPFYALLYPAFNSLFVPCVVLLLCCAVFVLLRRFFPGTAPVRLQFHVCWILLALLTAFSVAAGMRGGGLPSFFSGQWLMLRWHLLALAVFVVFFGALFTATRRVPWFDAEPSRRFVGWFLVGSVAFAFLFPGAVAMLRDGAHGIAQAYERHGLCAWEGDCGIIQSTTEPVTASVHALAKMIEGRRFAGMIGHDENLWVCVFERAGHPLAVGWSPAGNALWTVGVRDGFSVHDLFGNPMSVEATAGKITVHVTGAPVYVINVADSVLAEAAANQRKR